MQENIYDDIFLTEDHLIKCNFIIRWLINFGIIRIEPIIDFTNLQKRVLWLIANEEKSRKN
jgi:hypothetical protein